MNGLTTSKAKFATFSRSAIVGAAATLADLISLFLMVDVFGLLPQWANVPALLIGIAIQFFGNKFYAFQNRESAWVRQSVSFFIVEAGALTLNAGMFHLAAVIYDVPYLVARLTVGLLVYICFSYPLWRRVFK